MLGRQVAAEQIAGWNAASRARVHYADLEREPVEAEVRLDLADQAVRRRVVANWPGPPALSVGPGQTGLGSPETGRSGGADDPSRGPAKLAKRKRALLARERTTCSLRDGSEGEENQ